LNFAELAWATSRAIRELPRNKFFRLSHDEWN
jgi:hypothetical protein